MPVQLIRKARDRQPPDGNLAANPKYARKLRWLSSTIHSGSRLTPSGVLKNIVASEWSVSQDANNSFARTQGRKGIGGKNTQITYWPGLLYSAPTGLFSGATELTLMIVFEFQSSGNSGQWVNFRGINNHTLDIFSQTTSSITWGADWKGTWNGASQQTISNISDGDMLCLMACINSSGARFFHNGRIIGTKSGSSFTVDSAVETTIHYLGHQGVQYISAAWTRCLDDSEAFQIGSNPWQIFEPETIPLFFSAVTAQYARPTSEVSAGGWTASTGADLFAMLDEASADDGDYITSTTASTCEVALGSLSDPAVSTGHVVRYRISATGGGIIVRLREGTTTIASWTHNPAPASLTTYAQTLSGGEADSITNYAALKLQFEAI